jgi:hypothetical protein
MSIDPSSVDFVDTFSRKGRRIRDDQFLLESPLLPLHNKDSPASEPSP